MTGREIRTIGFTVTAAAALLFIVAFSFADPPVASAVYNGVMAAATVALLVAAIGALRQIPELRITRESALYLDLSRRWFETDLVNSRMEAGKYETATDLATVVMAAYAEGTAEYYLLTQLPDFFEDMAILVREGAIGLDLIREGWAGNIVGYWQHWCVAIERLREDEETAHDPDKDYYRRFEELAKKFGA